jgi:hypothetical protein
VETLGRMTPLTLALLAGVSQMPTTTTDPEALRQEVRSLREQAAQDQAKAQALEERLARMETWVQEGEVSRLARIAGYTEALDGLAPIQHAFEIGGDAPDRGVPALEQRLGLLAADAEAKGAPGEAAQARVAASSLERLRDCVAQKDVKTAWDAMLVAADHILAGRALAQSPPTLAVPAP